jgi:hypothetical protein
MASTRCFALCVLSAAGLAGCSSMLPKTLSDARIGFDSFEQAEKALGRVVPYQTTLQELEALGFKVGESPNVVHIGYPDSIARLAPNSAVPLDTLDPGIRECIRSRMACLLYEFHFGRRDQRRVGNFLADFFNFKRRTVVTGWRFTALVAVKNGKVLFASHGGEAHIDHVEERRNPLGPLQSSGEIAGGLLTN